jgi:hypothetical protein
MSNHVEAKMFDLNQTLNKLKLAEMLADAEMMRRMRSSEAVKQLALRSTTLQQASTEPAHSLTLQGAPRSHLTDTETLTRKVREDMVRNAQAEFAAVMAELKASQFNTTADEPDEIEDAILSQQHIQIDHVGEV